MKKGIKRLIAFVVTMSCLITGQEFNVIGTKAYAAANVDKPYLKSMYLSEGDNLNFSKDQYTYIVDVDNDIDELYIRTKPGEEKNTIKINGTPVTKEMKYKYSADLDYGKNKFTVEIMDENQNKSLYTIYVYRGGEQAVYLDDITIDDKDFGFNKMSPQYDIELDETDELTNLDVSTDEGKYEISANGKELINNSIKLKFKGLGKYSINLLIKDLDTGREGKYTLNIYFGIPVSPDVTTSINSALKPNQWVMINGRWRYNDSLGNALKDRWYYDGKNASYYHFNSIGNMQTGWINDNGFFYYLDDEGKMQTGWIYYEGSWYYLDIHGAMRTGWIEDDYRWYYLNRDGAMRKGWLEDNNRWYYLNDDGSMAEGWIQYKKKWYFFNDDGSMKIGWLKDNNEWYYFNDDGTMRSGEWLRYYGKWYYLNYVGSMRYGWLYKDGNYYYLDEDGSMITYPKEIDGYLYNFNEDGSVIVDVN